jgi:hypothetical protein
MKTVLLAIPVLLLLIVSPARAQGNEDILKKRFRSEYPEALKALEARFSKVEGTVKFIEDDPRKKDTPHREVLYSFKCMLPDMAVLTSIENNTEGQRVHSVSGTNKNYSFVLKKLGTDADFAIKSLEVANGTDAPRNSVTRMLRPILRMPYATRISNVSLLSNPHFTVRGVSTQTRNGVSLLKVEFDFPIEPTSDTRRKGDRDYRGFEGFFLVSPEEKWVLYEFEYREKAGVPLFLNRGTVEYQGTSDGFPNPKRVTRQTLKLPERNVVETHSYDFLDFRLAEVPDREFTLAAFGIPEEAAHPSKVARSRGLGYWLLALALAALAAAVFFKMTASRRKPSFPS